MPGPILDDLRSAAQMPGGLSLLCVLLNELILVGIIGLALWRILANLRLGVAADRSCRGTDVLRPGPAVVKGEVLREPGKPPPIGIEIDQRGVEEHGPKGGVSHIWTERARRVKVRPFRLRLEGGHELLMEPDQGVFLIDKLELASQRIYEGHLAGARTLVAELSPGEQVYAAGRIEERLDPTGEAAGYRTPPRRAPVLITPRGGRMLIATERLGARYRGRVRFHLRWLCLSLLVLTGAQGLIFGLYHLQWLRGETVVGRVIAKREYVTGSGKSRTTHHDLTIGLDNGSTVTEDAAEVSYRRAAAGYRVVLRKVGGSFPTQQLGACPTVHWFGGILGVAVAFAWALLFRNRRRRSRPWYDHAKLVHRASGPLDPNTMTT